MQDWHAPVPQSSMIQWSDFSARCPRSPADFCGCWSYMFFECSCLSPSQMQSCEAPVPKAAGDPPGLGPKLFILRRHACQRDINCLSTWNKTLASDSSITVGSTTCRLHTDTAGVGSTSLCNLYLMASPTSLESRYPPRDFIRDDTLP